MTNRTMTSIKAAITRFDTACQRMGFKHGEDPDTWADIEKEHALARQALENMIERNLK